MVLNARESALARVIGPVRRALAAARADHLFLYAAALAFSGLPTPAEAMATAVFSF